MNITPLALGAWISIWCGISLLRSSVTPYRRDIARFGPRTKRAMIGYVLLAAGVFILVETYLRHHWHRL